MDLRDGESTEMQGSGKKPYILKNTGGVFSCSCPAWRNQSKPIDKRTCKHLIKLRGKDVEEARIGGPVTKPAKKATGGRKPAEKKETAPAILLAHKWDNEQDLTGWWISEKLDGVRAYWDGENFVSRLGNIYHAPEWFKVSLPDYPLDGELWVGRGEFQKTVSIVRRQDGGEQWRDVTFLVFDLPTSKEKFEDRVMALQKWEEDMSPGHAKVVAHKRCRDLDHLSEHLEDVLAVGGEGLMLREPGSLYESNRSTTLLKVKKFFDTEAVVVSHVPGRGRHKGRLGALKVRLPSGTEFSVGSGFSDAQRETPPTVGSVISFRYQELTKDGVPRFPTFIGERYDVTIGESS